MPEETKPSADFPAIKTVSEIRAESAETDPKPSTDDVIETWFRDHFAGSSALAATTEAYNAAYAAKDDLKKRLAR